MLSLRGSLTRLNHLPLICALLAVLAHASPTPGLIDTIGNALEGIKNGFEGLLNGKGSGVNLESLNHWRKLLDDNTEEQLSRRDLLAPKLVQCPTGPLVQPATSLPAEELAYFSQRKPIADGALQTWLASTGLDFGNITGLSLPTPALATSGGGYRSALTGAGVYQALDGDAGEKARTNSSLAGLAGLAQALSYDAGLSGGGWLVASRAANGWPSISTLLETLWSRTLTSSFAKPEKDLGKKAKAVLETKYHIYAKRGAHVPFGGRPNLPDVTGWLLAKQFLGEGAAMTWSGVRRLRAFQDHAVPLPIVTALGTKAWAGECPPSPDATQYEFTPFTFGSFDSSIAGFIPTQYLGSAPGSACVTSFDTTAFLLGTTSNLWGEACAYEHGMKPVAGPSSNEAELKKFTGFMRLILKHNSVFDLAKSLSGLTSRGTSSSSSSSHHGPGGASSPSSSGHGHHDSRNGSPKLVARDHGKGHGASHGSDDATQVAQVGRQQGLYASIPNPFYDASADPKSEKAQMSLTLVDVGEIQRHDPIWPFLHRPHVDVLIVSDNSGFGVNMTRASSTLSFKKRGHGGDHGRGRRRGGGGSSPGEEANEYPSGGPIRRTYEAAVRVGLERMPFIPTEDVFEREGLNSKPVVFGCPLESAGSTSGPGGLSSNTGSDNASSSNATSSSSNVITLPRAASRNDKKKLLIIRLPNFPYTFPSGQATEKLEYTRDEIAGMVGNGVQIATRGGDQRWPKCLACLMMMGRDGVVMPSECEGCSEEYCYSV